MEKAEKSKVFQVQASLTSINALTHGTLKMVFNTQEGIGSESMKRLFELYEKLGWISFNVEKIEAENIANLPKIDPSEYDDGKTPSQRLKNIIYVLWAKKGKPGFFEDYKIRCYGKFERIIKDEVDKFE